jgi:hypothetical protein
MKNDTIIYLPAGDDATADRWDVVAAALRAAGVTDIRPAPMPSLAFQPRHARLTAPVLVSSAEV